MTDPGRGGRPTTRDAAWIDREYGREKWPVIRAEIDRVLATGERSLGRVLATLVRSEWGCPGPQPVPTIALGSPVRLPASLAWHGFYACVAEAVIAACRHETRAIVDLGCGWGRSLFDVWLRGGPRHATYHAMEFTQAGLDCVAALAALEPELQIRTARFDFHHPDFTSIPRGLPHAVVFTVSSLHQVTIVDKESFRAILNVADAVDCLHFEQIGWQMEGRSSTDADREYALRNRYNENLWQVLTSLSDEREITLAEVDADLFGLQSEYPMSLVHWRRVRR